MENAKNNKSRFIEMNSLAQSVLLELRSIHINQAPPLVCAVGIDYYGRAIWDQYGHPVLEYTIGSCQSPPN